MCTNKQTSEFISKHHDQIKQHRNIYYNELQNGRQNAFINHNAAGAEFERNSVLDHFRVHLAGKDLIFD